MHITEAMKIAFLSLWANKLRSALTLLGVVIGVAAVIAVVTFVNGINGYVAEKILNLGADAFICLLYTSTQKCRQRVWPEGSFALTPAVSVQAAADTAAGPRRSTAESARQDKPAPRVQVHAEAP